MRYNGWERWIMMELVEVDLVVVLRNTGKFNWWIPFQVQEQGMLLMETMVELLPQV